MSGAKDIARGWVRDHLAELSDWCATVWDFGETAWREYRSAAFYVDLLRKHGFAVEAGSGGMPTAFAAVWENGKGPTIGGYAEYDGVPGNCQAADVVKRPRAGLSPQAGGHTDPHSALGIASLGGFLAAKSVMERLGIKGRLKFMGEPAEKTRGSKPIHAARGYYDDMDAAISFHPFWAMPYCNTVRWDTHSGAGYGVLYSFTCEEPETWMAQQDQSAVTGYHAGSRAPGANDAVVSMYLFGKALKEHMLPTGKSWSINEAVLTMGQATADNLPAGLAQIMYFIRVPTIDMAEHVVRALDRYADSAAQVAHCRWRRNWIAKSRPGLPNHAMARATYANLETVGPPRFGAEAIALAQTIQRNLGLEPMARPFMKEIEELIAPEEAERRQRQTLPPVQLNQSSDDYTEYCWHAPTVRLTVGRPLLAAPRPGHSYPSWVINALGGLRPCIDPMISVTAQTIGMTVLDLLGEPALLQAAKAEFVERTGGGIGGSNWIAPLCDYDPPIHYRWPEYVETPRGRREWVIPTQPTD
ncbi:MAG: amidohydrolase [Alphaproteobacteria bacterium]|nr:amidohydrolase [Alphaproteobacteria bacterium]